MPTRVRPVRNVREQAGPGSRMAVLARQASDDTWRSGNHSHRGRRRVRQRQAGSVRTSAPADLLTGTRRSPWLDHLSRPTGRRRRLSKLIPHKLSKAARPGLRPLPARRSSRRHSPPAAMNSARTQRGAVTGRARF